MLIEEDVEVTDEVVALLTRTLRRSTIPPALPSKHRLTDMDTTVVDDISLEDSIA